MRRPLAHVAPSPQCRLKQQTRRTCNRPPVLLGNASKHRPSGRLERQSNVDLFAWCWRWCRHVVDLLDYCPRENPTRFQRNALPPRPDPARLLRRRGADATSRRPDRPPTFNQHTAGQRVRLSRRLRREITNAGISARPNFGTGRRPFLGSKLVQRNLLGSGRDEADARRQLESVSLKLVDVNPDKKIAYSPWRHARVTDCVEDVAPVSMREQGVVWTVSGKTYSQPTMP